MPLVSRTFDQLIDFTRTSAGTYVNSAGLVALTPASRNLLTFTQEFDTAAWAKTAATVTANAATAPDGTPTADKLVENSATSTHYLLRNITSSGTNTFSFYAKAAERSQVGMYVSGSEVGVGFNLLTGAVISITNWTNGSPLATSIVAVGDGWYRCSVTVSGGVTQVLFGPAASGAGNYTGDGTSGVFIWGAQLEQASAATTYTRNFGGVYPPRFDYDPVTLAPKGLLIEEQRTNLLTYSEQFDNAAWTKLRATVTANATTSPDGTTNADQLLDTAVAGTHVAIQTITKAASAITYAATVFAKQSTLTKGELRFSDQAGNGVRCTFDVAAGTVGSAAAFGTGFTASSSAITALSNGWYRITLIGTTNTATTLGHEVYLADATGNTSYTGTGTGGLFVWGAQLEAGAFATSYIPTVASQVTRTADQTTIDAPNFAPWYNQSEGTFVISMDCPANGVRTEMSVDDGTVNNMFRMRSQVTDPFFIARVGGANVVVLDAGTITANTTYTQANAYAVNNYGVSVNGGAAVTSVSGAVPTVNRMTIGWESVGNYLNGHIRSIRYYPTRLSDAQLAVLSA